jgi:hypothetical protein
VKAYPIYVNSARTPEKGSHSPSWPNGLIIIIILAGDRERSGTGIPPRDPHLRRALGLAREGQARVHGEEASVYN